MVGFGRSMDAAGINWTLLWRSMARPLRAVKLRTVPPGRGCIGTIRRMLFEVAFFLFGAKLENRTLFKVARYVPDQVYVDKLLRGSRREQPDALPRRSNVASAKRFVPPTDPNKQKSLFYASG